MPQLDILIVFPQIIWLIFSFTTFYFFLTFYFLPFFLKSIKSKKLFINSNYLLNLKLIEEINFKQKKNINLLNLNLKNLKEEIFTYTFSLNNDFHKINSSKNTIKLILNSSKQTINYCNNSLLNSINFYPKHLNL